MQYISFLCPNNTSIRMSIKFNDVDINLDLNVVLILDEGVKVMAEEELLII